MKLEICIYTKKIGKEGKPFTSISHCSFSENELEDILKNYLKQNGYEDDDIKVEIEEITSR